MRKRIYVTCNAEKMKNNNKKKDPSIEVYYNSLERKGSTNFLESILKTEEVK